MAGLDFNKIFALVAKFITIRCIIAIGRAMDWEKRKCNIFNGVLEVEIYMDQPKSFVQEEK